VGRDDFPTEVWLDTLEDRLEYAEAAGQLDRLLPRLRGEARQRSDALAEITVA
jgi:hypothetical protein